MTKTDDEIRQGWKETVQDHVERALDELMRSEHGAHEYLARCVAELCETTAKEMLADNNYVYNAHARWLYWYAYRYMTNDSYEKMSRAMANMGHAFSCRTIQSGVNKMAMMIADQPIWLKRWTIIKRIIKLRDTEEGRVIDNTVVIQIPKELKDKLTIKIQEK